MAWKAIMQPDAKLWEATVRFRGAGEAYGTWSGEVTAPAPAMAETRSIHDDARISDRALEVEIEFEEIEPKTGHAS
jgi:hypothetical protein